MPEKTRKTYTYKYVKAITVGHKPDGKPIRKYIRENNKAIFEQKVRYYQNLNAKGVQIVGKALTVEQWAWQWYPHLQGAEDRREPAHQLRDQPQAAHPAGDRLYAGDCRAAVPSPAARQRCPPEDGKPLAQGTVRQILYTL